MIKTRFAPSPTGELHIGSVRTALFAYLFAKHNEGEFLLRIEDTDRERFVEGATDRIIEALKWFNFVPDNLDNIIVQSERKDIYLKHAADLIKNGNAYVCTCSKERLEEVKKEQEVKKLPSQYDRHCRDLGLEYKEGCTIRLKMPDKGEAVFDDLVRGQVKFDYAFQGDPIIVKSDGFPTYHLAVVVDDHEMDISHILRAEEWLSSTPKSIFLYGAFGWEAPKFGHLPVILGPDKKHKLSKRDGNVSVIDFKNKGYLPEALINFIAFLGWNPKDEREEFSLEELVKEFKIENVNKAPAVFNIEKLNDINEKKIREEVRIKKLEVRRLIKELYHIELTDGELELAGRGGFKTLKEIAGFFEKLRKEPEYDPKLLIFKKSTKELSSKGLALAKSKIENAEQWNNETIEQLLAEAVSEGLLSNGDVFWPVRVALSGEEKSPSPVELMIALGKEESEKRIEKAAKLLSSS